MGVTELSFGSFLCFKISYTRDDIKISILRKITQRLSNTFEQNDSSKSKFLALENYRRQNDTSLLILLERVIHLLDPSLGDNHHLQIITNLNVSLHRTRKSVPHKTFDSF